jgi:hypothetical protein
MICGAEGLLRQELPAIQTGAYFMLAMTADGTKLSITSARFLAVYLSTLTRSSFPALK